MVDSPSYARAEITRETAVRSMPPLEVSDRAPWEAVPGGNALQAQPQLRAGGSRGTEQRGVQRGARGRIEVQAAAGEAEAVRSEEHTSELQSQSNLVCRLLLEKKKKTTKGAVV